MQTPRYSIKQTDFVVPLVLGLYKISLDNVDTGRPLAQDCPALDIILTLVLTVLASGYPFLPSCRKGELRNSTFVSLVIVQQGIALEQRLRSAQWHKYTLPRLPEIYRKPPK